MALIRIRKTRALKDLAYKDGQSHPVSAVESGRSSAHRRGCVPTHPYSRSGSPDPRIPPPMHRFALLIIALLGPLLLGNCGADSSPSDGSTEVIRSTHPELGVPLVLSGAGLAERDLGWKVSTEPDLVLGGLEGVPEPQLFSRVNGAKQRADGTLLVIDRDAAEVRMFDREGNHLRTTGGLGDGPTEFTRPTIRQTPDHSEFLLYDAGHRRLVTLDPLGDIRSERSRNDVRGNPIGMIRDTVIVNTGVIRFTNSPRGGITEWPTVYTAVAPDGSQMRIDSVGDPMWITVAEMEGQEVPSIEAIPFDGTSVEAMHFNFLLVIRGAAPEIHWYGPDGSLERLTAVDLPAEAPSRDEIVDYGRRLLESYGAEVGDDRLERYRDMRIPERRAAFDALIVDTQGYVWARRYIDPLASHHRWLVFAPAGSLLGYVELPAELDLYQIGPDFVLGRLTDDFGVHRVVRHTLTRN